MPVEEALSEETPYGRYVTSVSQTGNAERLFQVIDALIHRSRTAK